MRIIDSGTVFSGEKGTDHASCAFPGVCVLPGGRWICSFRAAPTKAGTVGQHPLVTWSDDQGRYWRRPISPFVPPLVDGMPGLFRGAQLTVLGGNDVLITLYWVDHSDPSLPFFNEETEGLLDSRVFFATSSDGGENWSVPAVMDTTPYDMPTPITGPVLLLPNGEWACQFELNKHYYDTSIWRHSAVLMFSKDHGKTWPEHVVVANDPENRLFYWDQRPAVLGDGRILDVFWTYDNHLAAYLSITSRESFDNGRTWSPLWDTDVSQGQPAPPVSLPDGKIAMAYVDRTGLPAIRVRTSSDGGRTYPLDTEIAIYEVKDGDGGQKRETMQDAWAEMAEFAVGLPTTAALPGGEVLVIYYAGPQPDLTDVRWARIGE